MALVPVHEIDDRLEQLYDLVAEDEDARSCRDLDDDACRWATRSPAPNPCSPG